MSLPQNHDQLDGILNKGSYRNLVTLALHEENRMEQLYLAKRLYQSWRSFSYWHSFKYGIFFLSLSHIYILGATALVQIELHLC